PMTAGIRNHHIRRRNTPARSPRLTPVSFRMSLAVIGSPSASRCARSTADAQIHRGLPAGVGWGAHHSASVRTVSADLGYRRKGAVGSALHITGTAGDRRDFSAKNARRSLAQAALLDLLEQGLVRHLQDPGGLLSIPVGLVEHALERLALGVACRLAADVA